MPFTIEQFASVRPYVYHLTARQNLYRLRRTARLESATRLLTAAGNEGMLSQKRRQTVEVAVNGETIFVRDQAPLHAGNIRFEGGWDMQDLLSDLNSRVFFWPGSAQGPISYGLRHFQRYELEQPILLRVGFLSLIEANNGSQPMFCRFNSGSPRCSKGVGSSRGPNTFTAAHGADFTPGKVVEVTYLNEALLPADAQIADLPNGPWTPLL